MSHYNNKDDGDSSIKVKVARDDFTDHGYPSQWPQPGEEDLQEEGGARRKKCRILVV